MRKILPLAQTRAIVVARHISGAATSSHAAGPGGASTRNSKIIGVALGK